MAVASKASPTLESTYARELEELCVPWRADDPPNPRPLVVNDELAVELGLDPSWLRTEEGLGLLVGSPAPPGAAPVAQGYAGHQFGTYSPRLGDGRALLLGELVDGDGGRRDLHLKGSGRTPFARGGDGKAAVGPMLREYVIGEAMHALGIPTSRALAVVATGAEVRRETMLPGAVLSRVAASHIRVGTFQYAAAGQDGELVRRLADYAIARHHPAAHEAEHPYVAFFESVLEAQADLVARWMQVGFVHGVMNTDNMAVSGESIDFGPCAFIDAYDPAASFSSIDQGGRYAYGNQPAIAQWNLARLAEALLGLFAAEQDQAIEIAQESLAKFPERFEDNWLAGMRAKLGMADADAGDRELIDGVLQLIHAQAVDFTSLFRALSASLRAGEQGSPEPARDLFSEPAAFDGWWSAWRERVAVGTALGPAADRMDRVNPVYIPRNYLVEEALASATAGELDDLERLLAATASPFGERPGLERYASPAPVGSGPYRTFCGT